MKKHLVLRLWMAMMLLPVALFAQHIPNALRAPAYPIITIDPNTSGWSYTDQLYESTIRHWSDRSFPLLGVLKVDGQSYRFMGTEELEAIPVLPSGEDTAWPGRYVTTEPSGNWQAAGYDDRQWKSGEGPFGTRENEPTAQTQWSEEKIWVRRAFQLDESLAGRTVYLEYSHDDGVIIYVNGIEVVNSGPSTGRNKRIKLSEAVVNTLKRGENLIAGFCHNTGGNGLFDVGLFVEKDDERLFGQTATQLSVDVQAMQTHYEFACGDVRLKVSFTAPLFLDNLYLISRPVNYLTYEVTSPQPRQVELYIEAGPHWALNLPSQASTAETGQQDHLVFARTGSVSQQILGKRGDHINIDWGYFYLAGDRTNGRTAAGPAFSLRKAFTDTGVLPASDTVHGADKVAGHRHIAYSTQFSVNGTHAGRVLIGYDDIYAIQYFGQNLRGYWNRDGKSSLPAELVKADRDYATLKPKADAFDREFMQRYHAVGGREYAELCALAYRQAIAAHKLVEAPNGELLLLSKENDSNGSIGTVDVTYPSAPLFLLYNPELAKALLNAIFYYTESGKWTKPFAAHDVGTYPLANGQTYGGDMPVEESGNMLILTYAIAQVEKHARYAEQHWETLTTWANYLVEHGLDPDNQLCTDDFAGHFAHNANLSIKAIVAIGSYAKLAGMLGKTDLEAKYYGIARQMAAEWKKMAVDGDHYRLTFDKPGTWSQKYNMVWDKLFDMGLFDPDIRKTEIAYYLTKQNKYGLPLDNRETYTKTDWIFWTATMADDLDTFQAFIKPVHLFMNECTTRTPMSDWVFTDRPHRRGFKARSVVGGYFIKMLEAQLQNNAKSTAGAD